MYNGGGSALQIGSNKVPPFPTGLTYGKQPMNSNQAITDESPESLLKSRRRSALLSAAAEVSHSISSLLTLDELLPHTVDIICNAYGFYYAGIFLAEVGTDGQSWVVLKAGRGEAGRRMMAEDHRLPVGGRSMVGRATALNEARISLDVDQETVRFSNPYLPDTQSEVALPLAFRGDVFGALTVQSIEEKAFTREDISSLQAMADQLAVAIYNARLHQQNQELLAQASRRATLLHVGGIVSRNISSILDMKQLLSSTVDIICEAYTFYYAGIFLVEAPDTAGRRWAVLKAGRGEAGRKMLTINHKLEVGGRSMIGTAIVQGQARLSLDVDKTKQNWFANPYLPDTRSEMALPLIVHNEVIGALTVQSEEPQAFSEEDISSLQMMADQLAVAINNARLLEDLEEANQALLRTKTFESIATATGETIHWVGNKAAPIPSCVDRLREDVGQFLLIAADSLPPSGEDESTFATIIRQAAQRAKETFPDLETAVARLQNKPARKIRQLLDFDSVLEDLDIIEDSARVILKIKEDLIGPARRQKLQEADVVQVVDKTIKGFGLPDGVISRTVNGHVPAVKIDPAQLNRVLVNLIKNALEAMEGQPFPRVFIAIRHEEELFVRIDVADIGPGIPEAEITNIWMTFHTTKSEKGGTGLGLPACLQIMENMGGRIGVTSEVGVGSTFTLHVPVWK